MTTVILSELFPNEAQARVEAQEEKGDYNSGTVRFLAWRSESLPQRRASLSFN